MQFRFVFIILLLCSFQAINAKTNKYRLVINDNPAYNMTIAWNQKSGNNSVVYYDTIDHGKDFEAYAFLQEVDKKVWYKEMNNHFVNLKNLKASTTYYFVINDSDGPSKRFWFKTLSDDNNTPISMIAGGDSRRYGRETGPHEPRIQSNKVVARIRPDFVAFGGDYTDKDTPAQWANWLNDWQYTIGKDGRMTPILPTRGNHERSNLVMVNLFDVASPEVYYSINIGGDLIRMYTLNVMTSIAGDQTNWLKKDLEKNRASTIWKLVQYHYSIAPHHSRKTFKQALYRYWAPLFHDYGVQMVIECDSHVAKNTWPVKPAKGLKSQNGFVRDDISGTIYTGEGSWGLTRNADVKYKWTRETASFTQVKWIKVFKDSIQVYTILSAKSFLGPSVLDQDRFTLPKNMKVWKTENGNHFTITRKNPYYEEENKKESQFKLIKNVLLNEDASQLLINYSDELNLSYTIYNIKGKALKSGQVKSTIEIKNLKTGHYYLQIWDKSQAVSETKVFIKP
ncbi:MAG: fibronectin type III domain-containing protein [Bacteroidota bacterium]